MRPLCVGSTVQRWSDSSILIHQSGRFFFPPKQPRLIGMTNKLKDLYRTTVLEESISSYTSPTQWLLRTPSPVLISSLYNVAYTSSNRTCVAMTHQSTIRFHSIGCTRHLSTSSIPFLEPNQPITQCALGRWNPAMRAC